MTDDDHGRLLKRNGTDFFFYLCFGKATGDVRSLEQVVGISVREAYRNATMRKAFTVPDCLKERSRDARTESEDILRGCVIDRLLNAKDGVEYDRVHKEICEDLCKKYAEDVHDENNVPYFTPGNAQKWVNMTMKYLYEIYGLMSACGRGDEIAGLRKIFDVGQFLHVPIDTYVLEGLKESLGTNESFIVKGPGNSYRIRYEKTCDGEGKPTDYRLSNDKKSSETVWSKIEDYRIYEALRNSDSLKKIMKAEKREDAWPIEWESERWIEIGRERKKANPDPGNGGGQAP